MNGVIRLVLWDCQTRLGGARIGRQPGASPRLLERETESETPISLFETEAAALAKQFRA